MDNKSDIGNDALFEDAFEEDLFVSYKIDDFLDCCTLQELDKLEKEIEMERKIRIFKEDKVKMLKKEFKERKEDMRNILISIKRSMVIEEESSESEGNKIKKPPPKPKQTKKKTGK
jgi:hypothetical protein